MSFFSLVRVSRGSRELSTDIDNALERYRLTDKFPESLVSSLADKWKEHYRSISFAENTNELNDISKLFTELENSKDKDDFIKTGELIKTSLELLRENETPYFYSLL